MKRCVAVACCLIAGLSSRASGFITQELGNAAIAPPGENPPTRMYYGAPGAPHSPSGLAVAGLVALGILAIAVVLGWRQIIAGLASTERNEGQERMRQSEIDELPMSLLQREIADTEQTIRQGPMGGLVVTAIFLGGGGFLSLLERSTAPLVITCGFSLILIALVWWDHRRRQMLLVRLEFRRGDLIRDETARGPQDAANAARSK